MIYKTKNKAIERPDNYSIQTTSLIKKIVVIAVPITIGSSVFTLTNAIDVAMIMRRLGSLGYMEEAAKIMFGYYSGYAQTLINLPATLILAISISVVPAVSSALAKKNITLSKSIISSAVRITWQLSFAAAAGLFLFAKPIMNLLFPNDKFIIQTNSFITSDFLTKHFYIFNGQNFSNTIDATKLLTIISIGVGFVCIVSVTNAILQAFGKVWIPVGNMMIGGVLKVIINYYFVANYKMNILAAPFGTVVCFFVIMSLNLIAISNLIKVQYGFLDTVIKPLISAVLMGVICIPLYNFIIGHGYKNFIAILVSMAIAVLIYFASMLILRGFRKSDVEIMPYGNKLIRLSKGFLK